MVRLICENADCKKSSQVLRGWSFCPYCGKKYEEFGVSVDKMVDAERRRSDLECLYDTIFLIGTTALLVVALLLLMPAKDSGPEALRTWTVYAMFGGLIGWGLVYKVGNWLIDRFLIRPEFPELYKHKGS